MNRAAEKFEAGWVAGFMSGTSLDAVDGALIRTDGHRVLEFGPVVERKYSATERRVLQDATDAARAWNWEGPQPHTYFAAAKAVISHTHKEAYEALLAQFGGHTPVLAGVHGQTVLHRAARTGQPGATLQLIDAQDMVSAFGVPLAYDFRIADVQAGGQGAPLAPVYHDALMGELGEGPMAALNLGGVANITARAADGTLLAFDTGPANGPVDEWVSGHDRGHYDRDGQFAAAGRVHEGLLADLLDHPWFAAPAPKSLDRYDFNASMVRGLNFEDGAATLTAFSAGAVARAFELLPDHPERIIICGGGRHNSVFMQMLRAALSCPVLSAEQAGWRGDSIEAEAFAFLAARTAKGLPISFPTTTGVSQQMCGGQIINPPH